MGDVPENEQNWDLLAKDRGYKCGRCEMPIPFGERIIYFENKLCGWCWNQEQKLKEDS